jgi:hypothetical protein
MNDHGITNKYLEEVVRVVANTEMVDIAKALLAEREEREKVQDVWKDAPESCEYIEAYFYHKNGQGIILYVPKTYTRTLPKTRIRQIVEKYGKDLYGEMGETWADRIEKAILEYAEGEKNV